MGGKEIMKLIPSEDIKPENTSVLTDLLWKLYLSDAISKYTWTRAWRELSEWAATSQPEPREG